MIEAHYDGMVGIGPADAATVGAFIYNNLSASPKEVILGDDENKIIMK